jgi:hypothetical protein
MEEHGLLAVAAEVLQLLFERILFENCNLAAVYDVS